ncbi:MAG: T9SS type A sorting domain-containing protein [Bacteroidetes bacterium]|nr:T9SS type A sorting domain-containing protein [Bacteroidota bacterium]HET6242909.1 zinc-dependent metalloprotease family protein [Bacteroidia bacterium]
MRTYLYKTILLLPIASIVFSFSVSAQKTVKNVFSELKHTPFVQGKEPQINASSYKVFQIDTQVLKNELAGTGHRNTFNVGEQSHFKIPMPDGTFHTYRVLENNTMHYELAAKFPEIKSYDAYGISHPGEFVKFDITPHGFHAMVLSPYSGTVFIDPLFKGNSDYYMAYAKKDYISTQKVDCQVNGDYINYDVKDLERSAQTPFASCSLRTYRLAVAATAEYTTFHGGTIPLALAAQVTTMNRVNGVYENQMGITMEIVANNNLIVYTNASTDPYTNGNASTMLGQNQTTCDNVIGTSNYDIGHVFGTNSGGVAYLGSVCSTTNKARGVTGSSSPKNDTFDIDYVAHEMGHQFGANHTQNNSCNRNASTAMEPGSASTIMGYAGICSPNVQNNSDDHFHGVSKREIGLFVSSSSHTCPVVTSVGNTRPLISSTTGNITVPAGTPFALTAVASDGDGDVLTYCWEQMNNQVSTQPPLATSTGGPNFKSFSPTINPTRYFPNLTAIANNGPFTWERLATVSRTMNFRVSVHDNHPVAACNDFADISVAIDATSGPFVVAYPSVTGISWAGGSLQTVTWDIANTNNAPVNCANVDVFLSTDGGQTYPNVLATGTPNDGSHEISVPMLSSTTARIMVMSSAGTFFDISNNNFSIVTNGYTLSSAQQSSSTCTPDDVIYTIDVNSIGGFNSPVALSISTLPTGLTYSFSPASVTPPGSSLLTISNTSNVGTGNFNFIVNGTSATVNSYYSLDLAATNIITNVVNTNGTLTSSQSNASYQWVDCSNGNQPISGQTSQSFTPVALMGNYAVMINLNNCSAISDCFQIDITGQIEMNRNQFKIFPNPTKETVFISGININTKAIRITDLQGKMLKEINTFNSEIVSINIPNFPSGMYFIQIESSKGSEYYKLILE